jgi:proline dehydrogenase
MEQLLRNVLLFLSKSKIAEQFAKKWGHYLGADRFVAGESIENAIQAIKELNNKGILATLDHLGEFVSRPEEAIIATEYCLKTLDAIYHSQVRSHLSVKLTQLGLDISKELCLDNMCRIVEQAKKYDNFVRIDMEDYAHNEVTIEIFKNLRERYGENIGLVLQAYLYKVERDLDDLHVYRPNLRIVKGAYKESPAVAFPQKKDVDRNFIKIIEKQLMYGNYAAVATHDEAIIDHVKRFVKEKNIPNSLFEFQMLYGIRPALQEQLVTEGYTVRVYVPYGEDWYGYFMRRLAERPANVGFILKSLFKK